VREHYLIIETSNFYPCPEGSILKYEGYCRLNDKGKYEVRLRILDVPKVTRV